MPPKVSVVIPSYNSSQFIKTALKSIITQSYENWEALVIDDASTDDSMDVVDFFSTKDSRIRLITSRKNRGPALSRNKGIYHAYGQYIAFLDADDTWLPTKLEQQVAFLQKSDLPLTFSSYHLIDDNDNILGTRKIKPYISYTDLLKTNHIGNLTGIYDVNKLGKIYMSNCGHEDYTLWLKILKQTKFAYGIKEPLAMYRVRRNSLSSNKMNALRWQWNIYKNIENLNLYTRLSGFILLFKIQQTC
jgi:glycosyltransferase involved in cell wall biosynthesis